MTNLRFVMMTDPATFTKSFGANIIKGNHLKRNAYLQVILIGLSNLMWKVADLYLLV